MATFILTFVIVLLSVAGLAIGVLAGRAPLGGSCGGGVCVRSGCAACRRQPDAEKTP